MSQFTENKQAPEYAEIRARRDALAVTQPISMVGNSACNLLNWHNHLLAIEAVPVAPYNTNH